jgi:hypothetical protein
MHLGGVGVEIVEEILEVSKWLLSYFVVHEIVNFLFTVPVENNIIKIRSTHLLPIFYPFFFGYSCSRSNNTR